MEVGTIIIGPLCWALGITHVLLTTSVLLYLIYVSLRSPYRKTVRRRTNITLEDLKRTSAKLRRAEIERAAERLVKNPPLTHTSTGALRFFLEDFLERGGDDAMKKRKDSKTKNEIGERCGKG